MQFTLSKSTIITVLGMCAIFSAHAQDSLDDEYNEFADEQGEVIQYHEQDYILVTNAKQFLRSIISGQNILVAAQTEINLTPLLDDEKWWEKNFPYFQWLSQYESQNLIGQRIVSERVDDGRQLTIVGYKDIIIEGEANSRIVVEPRYAFSLNFVNCENISLRNLTIGHTKGGNCEGGVIGVKGGNFISLLYCNLYGCGTYGLQLTDLPDFTMSDSSIHDCTYGIMTLDNVESALFQGCCFYRNKEYALVDAHNSNIAFDRCYFYENNPTSTLFNIDTPFSIYNSYIGHPYEYLDPMGNIENDNDIFIDDTSKPEFLTNGFDTVNYNMYNKVYKPYFTGAKPTIVDFINSIIDDNDDTECNSWAEDWRKYQETGVADEYNTYIVDVRSGYVRIESKGDDNSVAFRDFCFWNSADGKNKLFVQSTGALENGKAVGTECAGLSFYRYDNDTNVLRHIGGDYFLLGVSPTEDYRIAYTLPRTGKDITFIDNNGNKGTLRWNGKGFTYSRNISQLPKIAKRTDAKGPLAVYVNQESDDISSVWLLNEETKTVEKVCNTSTNITKMWDLMGRPNSNAIEVPINDIGLVDKAWICPSEQRKIIAEGSPDGRNIATYIIDLDSHRAWQLPSLRGFVEFDNDKNEIIVSSFGYNNNRQYTYKTAYSMDGKYRRQIGNS